MVEISMYFATGFLLAVFGMLLAIPSVHGRAVRLTRRRLEGQIPACMAEVLANKDLARAQFAATTRRLEIQIEGFRAQSAIDRAELGRKSDAINRLKLELDELRTQHRPGDEAFALKQDEIDNAKRALAEKQELLVRFEQALAEQSALVDQQGLENIALKDDLGALSDRAEHSRAELIASEDKRNNDVRHIQNVLEQGELELLELSKQYRALKESLAVTKNELSGVNGRYEVAVRDARDREEELWNLREQLTTSSTLAERDAVEINLLKARVEALTQEAESTGIRLEASDAGLKAAAGQLSEKESLLAKLTEELSKSTALGETQKLELLTLKTEAIALNDHIGRLRHEWKFDLDRSKAAQSAAAQRRLEEHQMFEQFRRRVTELVQQLLAQRDQHDRLANRVDELETRLVAQSQLLSQKSAELEHLRQQVKIAREAEAKLNATLAQKDEEESATFQSFVIEKAKLHAALERANGERVRLAYELGRGKQQGAPSCAA